SLLDRHGRAVRDLSQSLDRAAVSMQRTSGQICPLAPGKIIDQTTNCRQRIPFLAEPIALAERSKPFDALPRVLRYPQTTSLREVAVTFARIRDGGGGRASGRP